jgi:hypothetical protein
MSKVAANPFISRKPAYKKALIINQIISNQKQKVLPLLTNCDDSKGGTTRRMNVAY